MRPPRRVSIGRHARANAACAIGLSGRFRAPGACLQADLTKLAADRVTRQMGFDIGEAFALQTGSDALNGRMFARAGESEGSFENGDTAHPLEMGSADRKANTNLSRKSPIMAARAMPWRGGIRKTGILAADRVLRRARCLRRAVVLPVRIEI